jgi:pyrophosphatase PpaX
MSTKTQPRAAGYFYNMNDYDTFLFDWDGTLARTVELWLREIRKRYREYSIEISEADSARQFGNLKAPLLYGLPPHQLSEFQEGVNEVMATLMPTVALYDDVTIMLSTLKAQGKQVGLVTTALRKNLDLVMSNHGVEDVFDSIVSSEDVRRHKPDPESILLAIERLQADPSKTIMLGDTDKDLLAAKNAGIDSVLFYPEAHSIMYDLEDLRAYSPKFVLSAWRDLSDELQ